MHLYDYQQQAQRTMNDAPIECWCMGLTGEAGELVDYLKKVLYHGHPLDKNVSRKNWAMCCGTYRL